MFTNLIVFNATVGDLSNLPEFVECGLSQEQSAGFVPPRDEGGDLVEYQSGNRIVRLMIETRSVPGDVVRRKADKRADEIETVTGRRPGRKEIREIRENIKLELLPHAFPKRKAVWIWIDETNSRLCIDSASQGVADTVVTLLAKHAEAVVTEVPTDLSPVAAMTQWLDTQEPPDGFSVDRECELQAVDASKARVRYANHALDIEEIRRHISEGKLPASLAMTWQDRVSFNLTDTLRLRKVKFQDGVFEGERGFDADVAIATGELRGLLKSLYNCLSTQ